MTREHSPQHDDSTVRHYRADGTLTVTRDDETNEHVIESRGRDPGDKWTRRVPATRTTVEPGEHLWSIPDNWTQRYKLKAEHGSDKGIYEIPETGDSVLVALSHRNDRITDAFHLVEKVGSTTWTARAEVDQDALSDALTHVNKYSGEFPDGVRHALEYLCEHPGEAVADAEEVAEMSAPECVEDLNGIPVSEFDPDYLAFRSKEGVMSHPEFKHESEVMAAVRDLLSKYSVVPPSPLVSVTVR